MWELLHQYRVFFIVAYVSVILVLAVYGFHRSHLVYLYLKNRRRVARPARRYEEVPLVTVQLPVFNEMYVVERLIEAVAAIDYPRDRFEIQVLDDSTDETREIAAKKCAEVAARGIDCKHITRADRKGYKAGALDHGLGTARGEFIAVFDADFVPGASFLRDTIDHFTDDGVGMVQARWGHLNGDFSGLTRVQSIMLDGHFIIEHTARNRSGRFFNFNGTAGVWRRTTIVSAGGWQHDTLTEDLDLSYRAQMKGWQFVYLPDVVAPAEIPCEMNSFKSQQFRWAKGSLQTARKILPQLFRSDLPWKVKFEAAFHLSNNVAYLFLVLLSLLLLPMLAVRGEHGWKEVLLLDLPLFFGTTLSIAGFYVMTQRLGDEHVGIWTAIRRVPLALSLGIGLSINQSKAVLEGLWGGQSEFVRTPKHGLAGGGSLPSDTWVSKKYRAAKSLVPVIEILFAAYFVATIIVAVYCRHFTSLPFLLLFLGGYLYVGVLSIHQRR